MSYPDIKTCEGCGEKFERPAPLEMLRWRARRYCSRRCGLATIGHDFHGGGAITAETMARNAAKIASEALLIRSIKYGLNHDSDLGMGYHAFMDRARELGLVAKNHGDPQFMGSIGSPVLTSGGFA